MSIKESALSAITSITQSDFVRAVTSAGASRRVTVSNLAKAIVESYTGSSLGGSARSIKTAFDSMNKYTITDLMTYASSVYTGVEGRIVFVDYGYLCAILVHIKTPAITSGVVSLPSALPAARTETYAALSSLSSYGGFVQYSGNTLVIRCAADTSNYINGCLVFVP